MGKLLSSVDGLIKLRDTLPPPSVRARGKFQPRAEADVWAWMGYEPAPHQKASYERRKRFTVDVWHRRAGKTVSKVLKLVARAYWCPNTDGRYAYVAPTYSQAKDIAWPYLSRCAEAIPDSEQSISELSITIPAANGSRSRIRLYGVDSPKQRLRGGYLDGCVADESQDIPEQVFAEQIRPMLADKSRRATDAHEHPNQWLDVIGTPKGKNLLYRLWSNADRWSKGLPVQIKSETTGEVTEVLSDEYDATLLPWDRTGMIDPAEIKALQAQYGPAFEQEFNCSFDAALKGAIFGYELTEIRKLGQIGHVPYMRDQPVNTAWDLGWNDHTVVWFYQSHGDMYRFIDYWEGFNASIPALRNMLSEKPYLYGTHTFPHDVEMHEIGTGKTRAATFRENGIRVRTAPKLPKPDQIAGGRKVLWQCWFDGDKCQRGLDLLALYRREKDEKSGLYKEEPVHDEASHAADSFLVFATGRQRPWQDSLRQSVGVF